MTVRSDIFPILCKSDTTLSITDEHLIIMSVDKEPNSTPTTKGLSILPLPTSLSHSFAEDDNEKIDNETENWSVPDPVTEDFQCIKNNFRVSSSNFQC